MTKPLIAAVMAGALMAGALSLYASDPKEDAIFRALFKAADRHNQALEKAIAYCKGKDMVPSIEPGQMKAQCNPKPVPPPIAPVRPVPPAQQQP